MWLKTSRTSRIQVSNLRGIRKWFPDQTSKFAQGPSSAGWNQLERMRFCLQKTLLHMQRLERRMGKLERSSFYVGSLERGCAFA